MRSAMRVRRKTVRGGTNLDAATAIRTAQINGDAPIGVA